MTFDGITTRAVVEELKTKIQGGFIKKINQIGPKQMTFQIYANKKNQQLFISVDSSNARFHLSEKKYENPQVPPNFVMVLRKHIGSARIENIEQFGLDRTVKFTFASHNELADPVEQYLLVEIMGRHSNIILLDENGIVIEAIQRVSHDMSRVRQIYPGISYEAFPANKIEVDQESYNLWTLLRESKENLDIFKLFYQKFTGFSPLISKEICFRSDIDPKTKIKDLREDQIKDLDEELYKIVSQIKDSQFEPSMYREPKDEYYPIKLKHLGQTFKEDPSMSLIIDLCAGLSQKEDRLQQLKVHLESILNDAMDKNERKLRKLRKDYNETLDREKLKEEADLLASNVHAVPHGADQLVVLDFYHEDEERIIPLDPKKSAWDNVNSKYHKFSKLKTANQLLEKKIPELENDLAYLQQLLHTVREADTYDLLEEIREELVKQGLIKARQKKKKKKKEEEALKPRHFLSENGRDIYVGRNNYQNDYITLKLANKDDIFFHAKTIPGAHVILKKDGHELKQEDIEAAAWLAAKHSSNKNDPSVEIDYTEKKNVYKAKGAKPGMVYYNDYQSINVNTGAQVQVKEIKDS